LLTDVKVQIYGAFMVDISNPDPVYAKCKVCSKKSIRSQSSARQRENPAAPQTPGEMTPISSIRLGDFFGGNVDILADSDTLCQLPVRC